MGNEASQETVTQHCFYCNDSKGFLGQEWDRRVVAALAKQNEVGRLWTLRGLEDSSYQMMVNGLFPGCFTIY